VASAITPKQRLDGLAKLAGNGERERNGRGVRAALDARDGGPRDADLLG
jgi:hypothetical protein